MKKVWESFLVFSLIVKKFCFHFSFHLLLPQGYLVDLIDDVEEDRNVGQKNLAEKLA
jgi:hypothetical protein